MIHTLSKKDTEQAVKNYGRGKGTLSLKNFRGKPFETEEDMTILVYCHTRFSEETVPPEIELKASLVNSRLWNLTISKVVFDNRMLQVQFYKGGHIEMSLNFADITRILRLSSTSEGHAYIIQQVDGSQYGVQFT